ncbi:MAG: type II restriction endonuclease [Calditrichaeota bacterium]|nr:MAG: type II restriction endonuclease [Calditrichota bacterium]
MDGKQQLGSQTAKNGFKNEQDIVRKFNNWKLDDEAQKWLSLMEYTLEEIKFVKAIILKGNFKSDIQVQITIKLKEAIDVENIQVKLVSNLKGFNQIDKRWVNEFSEKEKNILLGWLKNNKALIVNDILKGRGKFAAEWMLIAQKVEDNARWILKPMNYCLNFFGNGEIIITKRGNFKIGKITMQRKGGDNGRKTAQMLQFKINPAELFNN